MSGALPTESRQGTYSGFGRCAEVEDSPPLLSFDIIARTSEVRPIQPYGKCPNGRECPHFFDA